VKSIIISISAFLFLAVAATFLVFTFLFHIPPGEIINNAYSHGKIFLYSHDLVDRLTAAETRQLYQNTCTRRCHSSDLIEKKPRTAFEWEAVVNRMKAPDRAAITDRAATAIRQYLANHFLSNLPTVIPDKTMKHVKRYLWRSDFGAGDLYLDIIYIPSSHISLFPYLVASNEPPTGPGAIFVIYLNTHQGVIPMWNIADMAILRRGGKAERKATDWQIIYEDGQHHHRQGLLIFPELDESSPALLEVAIHLPGIMEKTFQWNMPVPSTTE
jgi:hypothetical protein